MFTDELTIDISDCNMNRSDEEIYNEYKNISNDGQDRSISDIINRCLGGDSEEEYYQQQSYFD